jgi:hypothetical protein
VWSLPCQLYDPATSTLSYVGKMFANMNARMMDLTEDINRMAGFPAQVIITIILLF